MFKTLSDLSKETGCKNIMDKVLNVGNKCDLVQEIKDKDLLHISAKSGIGKNLLKYSFICSIHSLEFLRGLNVTLG